jgi:hypothetical protein
VLLLETVLAYSGSGAGIVLPDRVEDDVNIPIKLAMLCNIASRSVYNMNIRLIEFSHSHNLHLWAPSSFIGHIFYVFIEILGIFNKSFKLLTVFPYILNSVRSTFVMIINASHHLVSHSSK